MKSDMYKRLMTAYNMKSNEVSIRGLDSHWFWNSFPFNGFWFLTARSLESRSHVDILAAAFSSFLGPRFQHI